MFSLHSPLMLCALLMPLMLTGCTLPLSPLTHPAPAYMRDADYRHYQQLKAEGKGGEARERLTALHTRYPNDAELTWMLAEMEQGAHRYLAALALYEAAIPTLPPSIQLKAKESQGLCYLHLGQFKESGALLAEVLAQDATQWRTINAFGVTLALTDQLEEAIQYFTLAEELSAEDPGVMNNLALAYAISGDYQKAKPLLEQALSRFPPDAPQHGRVALNLALVYGVSGELAMAEKIAAPHLPTQAALHHNLAIYALLSHNKMLAKQHLSKALASPHYTEASWDLMKQLE